MNGNNAQKTPFAKSISRFAEQKVLDQLQVLGKSLPCHVVAVSGSIVTVKFDVNGTFTLPEVTCPMFGPEYVRYPTQVGDLGVVMSVDCYIGGVSGLGGGVADLTPRANLSTLIWFPIASVNWSDTDNPNALVLYGPDGAVIRTVDKNTKLTLNKAGGIAAVSDKDITAASDTKIELTGDSNTLTADSANVRTSGVFRAGNGASGTFTSADGKTITVSHGIITSII